MLHQAALRLESILSTLVSPCPCIAETARMHRTAASAVCPSTVSRAIKGRSAVRWQALPRHRNELCGLESAVILSASHVFALAPSAAAPLAEAVAEAIRRLPLASRATCLPPAFPSWDSSSVMYSLKELYVMPCVKRKFASVGAQKLGGRLSDDHAYATLSAESVST